MQTDYKNCDYLSPYNNTKYAHVWADVKNRHAQYVHNKFMLQARKLDAQYKNIIKLFTKYFWKKYCFCYPNWKGLKGARGIIGLLFQAVVGIASEAVLAFIWQRKSKALFKAFLAMRKQQNFLEEAMTLYGTYSADSIEEIVDVINHLYENLTKHDKILGGSHPKWYKENIMERRVAHMALNSLLYLHELQMKYVNVYKDFIKKLYIYIDAICILSTGYLPI